MAAVLSIIAVIILAGSLFLVGCVTADVTVNPPEPVTKKSLHSLSREEVNALLENITVVEDKPREFINAKCYKTSLERTTLAYICPICGERTLYEFDPRGSSDLENTINTYRRLTQEIVQASGLAVRLDESALCAKCSGGKNEIDFRLIITYSDGSSFKSDLIKLRDLQMILGLFKGEVVLKEEVLNSRNDDNEAGTAQSADIYMKAWAQKHLRELLGLPKTKSDDLKDLLAPTTDDLDSE